MATTFINCTPHPIQLNDCTVFTPGSSVARVSTTFHGGSFIDDVEIFHQEFGKVIGLPEPSPGCVFIVSAIVLEATKSQGRTDVVAPATRHPKTLRNEQGHIISVPGFVA